MMVTMEPTAGLLVLIPLPELVVEKEATGQIQSLLMDMLVGVVAVVQVLLVYQESASKL
jgi:hypothetical protein